MAIDKALYQAPVGFVDEQAPPITIEIEDPKEVTIHVLVVCLGN